jgi:hypothetical protein
MSFLATKSKDDPQLRKHYAEAIVKYPDYYRLLEQALDLLRRQQQVDGQYVHSVRSTSGRVTEAQR